MAEEKRFGKLHKPRVMTQKDIDESLRAAFKGKQSQQQGFSLKPKPLRQQEQYQQPRGQKPQGWTPYRAQQQQQTAKPQPQQEEPYWNGQEWETWALQLYKSFPDSRQFLPDWFIEAVEAEYGTK